MCPHEYIQAYANKYAQTCNIKNKASIQCRYFKIFIIIKIFNKNVKVASLYNEMLNGAII